MARQIDWLPILEEISAWCEDKFEIALVIDNDIISEINTMVSITLDGFEMENPNVAKVSECWGPTPIEKLECVVEKQESI